MKEHEKENLEAPKLFPFTVYYIKKVSTWHNDWEHHGKRVIMLPSKPMGEDRRMLEMRMEDDFIHDHRRHRKNLADITYKITQIRALPPEAVEE